MLHDPLTTNSCGNVGKLTRITAIVESPDFKKVYPRKVKTAPFLVIDGFIDFLLPSIASNASGAITGLANFAPVRTFPRHIFADRINGIGRNHVSSCGHSVKALMLKRMKKHVNCKISLLLLMVLRSRLGFRV